MSGHLAGLFLILLFTVDAARAHCDADAIKAQIDRAKEARDDFYTFEHLDEREGADQICLYINRLATARDAALASACAGEALRLGAYAQRLLDDANRAREAFLRRQATSSGAGLHLGPDFCLN